MALFETPETPRQARGQWVWVIAWLAVTVIGAFVLRPDPAGHGTHQQLGLPPCPSILLFQRPCPGCGLTTSWTALLDGDLPTAFRAHPLGPPLYALFTLAALACFVGAVRGLRFRAESRPVNTVLVATVVLLAGFGAVRFATVTVPLEDSLPRWLTGRQP